MKFHTIISKFRNKLTIQPNQGEITLGDVEKFYNTLNKLNFRFVLFSKYYRKYIDNLKRLKPDPEDNNPDLSLLRVALAENKWKPTTPLAIFIHTVKYDNKITSKPFIAYQKKQNRKKLNAPLAKVKESENPKSSGKWTRVPISQHYPKNESNCCQGNKC